MSFDGSVHLVWGGDRRRFCLGIDELIALQDKRNSGPLEIVTRLQLGMWRVQDVVETIRIGLLGAYDGAATPEQDKAVQELVDRVIRPGRITESVLVAQAILLNALSGDPSDDDRPKKKRRTSSRTKGSPPVSSTKTE